ncbi:MAG: hypothetical protein ACRD12_11960 [Acidimicrobiales bacterium]
MSTALSHPLDERIARAAVSWSLDPMTAPDETADRLLALARGNRTAVERALGRIGNRTAPLTTPSGRAAHVLLLTLARGEWDW